MFKVTQPHSVIGEGIHIISNIYQGKSSEVFLEFLGIRLIHLTFGSSLDCDVDVKAVSGKNSILWLLFQLVGSPGRAVVRWADCGQLQYSALYKYRYKYKQI